MVPIEDRAPYEGRRVPVVVLLLVAANIAVLVYMLGFGEAELERFVRTYGLVPAALVQGIGSPELPFSPYSALVTSLFIHGGFVHILGNLLFLWVFGDNVESALGHLTFLAMYLLSGVLATLVHVFFFSTSTLPTVGASGAIAGVLGAYLLLFPQAQVRVLLFFGPFFTVGRVAALLIILGWFIMQVFRGVADIGPAASETGGVAYLAHAGGFVAGAALTVAIRRSRRQPLGNVAGALHWSDTFRNWLIAVVLLTASLGYLTYSGGSAGVLTQGLVVMLAAAVALIDGLLRAVGRPSLLGTGRGIGRLLAVVQVFAALGVLGALLA